MQLPKYTKTVLRVLGAAVGLFLGGFVLLPLLLPFVLGYLFSLGAEPGVRLLERKTNLSRWLRSGICVTVFFLGTGAVVWFFCRILWVELLNLVRQLPELLRQVQPTLDSLRASLEALAGRAPQALAGPMIRWIRELFAGGDLLLRSGYSFLSNLVSGVITGLPGLVLTLITTLIATYMISASLPEVKQWLRTRLPVSWQKTLREGKRRCHTAMGGWLKAQLNMILIVFLLLTAGLWLLRVDSALLFGGIIALLDALPVLATGTVLIPWALISFLQGRSALGFGLLALYAVTSLARTALEPRLVGKHLGLHPLITLIAFYTGYRLFGIPGMVLFPLLATIGKQLLGGRNAAQAQVNSE